MLMVRYDQVRSMLELISQISSQLPERTPALPERWRTAQYAAVGKLYARKEGRIFDVLNAMIASSGNDAQTIVPEDVRSSAFHSVIILSEGPVSESPLARFATVETEGENALHPSGIIIHPSATDPIKHTIIPDTPENRAKYRLG
jgi:hypothetical protein